MPRTTGFRRGDVVLVEFVLADESGTKLRPALIVSGGAYHRSRQEVVIAAITGNVTRRLFGDHVISDWRGAGLLFPSTVTGIVRTIKASMIRRALGSFARPDLDAFGGLLRASLDL